MKTVHLHNNEVEAISQGGTAQGPASRPLPSEWTVQRVQENPEEQRDVVFLLPPALTYLGVCLLQTWPFVPAPSMSTANLQQKQEAITAKKVVATRPSVFSGTTEQDSLYTAYSRTQHECIHTLLRSTSPSHSYPQLSFIPSTHVTLAPCPSAQVLTWPEEIKVIFLWAFSYLGCSEELYAADSFISASHASMVPLMRSCLFPVQELLPRIINWVLSPKTHMLGVLDPSMIF